MKDSSTKREIWLALTMLAILIASLLMTGCGPTAPTPPAPTVDANGNPVPQPQQQGGLTAGEAVAASAGGAFLGTVAGNLLHRPASAPPPVYGGPAVGQPQQVTVNRTTVVKKTIIVQQPPKPQPKAAAPKPQPARSAPRSSGKRR